MTNVLSMCQILVLLCTCFEMSTKMAANCKPPTLGLQIQDLSYILVTVTIIACLGESIPQTERICLLVVMICMVLISQMINSYIVFLWV